MVSLIVSSTIHRLTVDIFTIYIVSFAYQYIHHNLNQIQKQDFWQL